MGRSRRKQPDGPVQPENSDQSVNINRADSGTAEESKKTEDRTEVVKNAAKDDARENAPKAGKDLSGEPVTKKASSKELSALKETSAQKDTSALKETLTALESSMAKESPAVKKTPMVKESPAVKESSMVNKSPSVKESSMIKETPMIKESPAAKESPAVNKSSMAKDSTAIENSSAIKEVSTIKKTPVGKTLSKEQPTKEPVSRKAPSKTLSSKAPPSKEILPKEHLSKEPSTKEPSAKESSAKEPSAKKSSLKEPPATKVPAKESAATQERKKEIKKVPSRERPRSRKAADSQNHPVEVREVPEAGKKTAGNSDTRGKHSRKQGQASEQAPGQAPVESRDRRRSASRGKQSAADNELRRYILLLSVPLIALILVVVLLISGNFRGSGEAVTVAPSRHSVDTLPENAEIPVIEPDTKEYFHDFGGSILSQDTVPEINQLMEQYFLATTDCDMGTFLHLFTSQDTSEEERFRQDFEKQKQYIEGYRNISCYTTPGLGENSYAAYVYYEIKYVGVETPAPSLVQIYAVKGEDGIYRIFDQEMSPELEDFLEQLSVNEDVRLLISQVDQQAEEAMAADPALNERIQYMKQGPDYMREEEAPAQESQEGDTAQQ